jgi:hypothetical protein
MKKNIYIIAAIGLGITFNSCNKKGCTDPVANNYDARAKKNDNSCTYDAPLPTTANINLNLTHKVGTENFQFNYSFTDGSGNEYQFTRAQIYLSSPEYLDDDMNVIAAPKEYALVSPNTNSYPFGTVPADKHIHMMNIGVGVDSVANHSDPGEYNTGHPLAYQTPSIHWNWNSGYIFIAIEGVVDIDGNGTFDAGETFLFHIGMDALFAKNSNLMTHFNSVGGQTHNLSLSVNWGQLLNGIDLSTDNSTHSMGAGFALASIVSNNAKTMISVQ